MTIATFRTIILGKGVPLWLACLVATTGVVGCKKQPSTATPAAGAAPSGSVGVTASSCEDYAKQLCEKAGSESATCEAIRTSTALMPPAACAAGLKDVPFSVKKLESLQKSCEELVSKLCAEVGPESESCTMVTGQTKQFPPERCKAMLAHIPEIVADLKKMEQSNKPLEASQQAALAQGAGPSFGPANAKVVMVEFSDFQCPFCSRAASVVHQVRQKYADRVRFIFRQFPLPMHPQAREAAEASLAANAQGKFWEYHDRLFENQSQLSRAQLEDHAKQVGLNVAAFKKALDEHKFAAPVDSDVKLGEQVQVNGTPTVFINGARVPNPTSFEAVSALIENALKANPG